MGSQGRQLARRSARHSAAEGLRILLDARKLGDGGIGVYIDNLVRGLLGLRRASVRVKIAAGDRSWPSAAEDRFTERLHIGVIARPGTTQRFPWHEQVEVLEDPAPLYSWDELVRLPRRLPWSDFDVFHTPHFMLPFAVPLPTVVTLHDLIHVLHPERRYYPFVANVLIRSALRRATRVIAVSQATYQDTRRLIGDSSKVMRNVRVISNAIDPFYLEPPLDDGIAALAHSKRPFFLSVLSNTKPHKGFEDLLSAWSLFSESFTAQHSSSGNSVGGKHPRLFVAGLGADQLADNAPLLARIGSRDDIVLLGSVSKEELRAWYRAANALIIPSRAEGFGLPVIEAHASGTPVVMRPVPALLELVSGCDFVASDMSVPALAAALSEAARSLSLGAESAGRGEDTVFARNNPSSPSTLRAETAARYDLLDVARATLYVYHEALSELER